MFFDCLIIEGDIDKIFCDIKQMDLSPECMKKLLIHCKNNFNSSSDLILLFIL